MNKKTIYISVPGSIQVNNQRRVEDKNKNHVQ